MADTHSYGVMDWNRKSLPKVPPLYFKILVDKLISSTFAVGAAADLVLFDPLKVIDAATFTQPQQLAEGIEAVWVNGVLSYAQKTVTGIRAGKFLARQRDLRIGFY
jgi:hypothetical protein